MGLMLHIRAMLLIPPMLVLALAIRVIAPASMLLLMIQRGLDGAFDWLYNLAMEGKR